MALLTGLSGCVKEPVEPSPAGELPYPEGGEALIEMSVTLPCDIRTKAMADDPQGITSMRVAVFGSSGYLKETVDVNVNDGYFQSATTTGDAIKYNFKVKLTLTDSKRLRIHVIANYPAEKTFPWKGEDEVMRRYAYTEGMQDAYWCRFILTNGLELKQELVHDDEYGTDNYEYVKDANGYYVVTDEVTAAFTDLPLLRNFAKVSVESTTPQLILNTSTTMAIINKPRYGSVAPSLPTSGFVEDYYTREYSWLRENYDGFSPFDTQLVNTDPDHVDFKSCIVDGSTITGGDFMYERPRETRTPSYLIIHGKYRALQAGKNLSDWKSTNLAVNKRYPNDADAWLVPESEAVDGYYKIDFMDDEGYYAVFRNFRYHIRITGVSKPGAETPGAAGSTGGTGDISSSTEAQGLTDISDGYGRIAVSYVEMTLVDQHPMIELKYKFIPDVEGGDNPDNSLDSEGGPVSIVLGEKTGTVNIFSDTIDSSIPAGTDIGSTGTGGKGLIRVLSGNDTEGYRTIRFTTNNPPSSNRTSQTIKIIGQIDEHRSIYREVKYFLMEKQTMTVSCVADVPNSDYANNYVESTIGQGVNVNITIPIMLPESMFPLVFNIESSELSITPNTTKYTTENLPVESGLSICTGKESKTSFHYVKTLSFADYEAIPDNNGKTFTCHFKTNKAVSASTVYVTNDYFNKGSARFENYTLYYFKNLSFSKYRAAANTNLNFSFNLDDRDEARPRTVKVTLDGLVPQNPNANGWGTISAADGIYSYTISSGSSATLALKTITTAQGYDNTYAVTLEAVNGQTGTMEYHSAELYNMSAVRKTGTATFTSTWANNTSTFTGNDGVQLVFANYDRNANYMQMSNWRGDGTITVSSPTTGFDSAITRIAITYYNGANSQTVTYSPSGTSSNKTEWVGSASQVVITMGYSINNKNRVQTIAVEYEYYE